MFKLTPDEKAEVIANCGHLAKLKFSKALPFPFTEHGFIQRAYVLASAQAVQMGHRRPVGGRAHEGRSNDTKYQASATAPNAKQPKHR